MRTAVVTESYPPELNGVAQSVARLVQHLTEHGHRVDLVRPAQHGERRGDAATAALGGSELRTPGVPLPMYRDLRFGLLRATPLVERWQQDRPSVVHVATEGPLGWAALRAARQLAIPVSADFRTNFPAYAAHYGFGWAESLVLAYLRAFHNRADVTFVPTRAMRDALANVGFERLEVVGRGVDLDLFSPARRSERRRAIWGVAPDQPVVLYVGRLAAEKNVELVFDAFRAMRSRARRARLVVVGDGPLRERLEKQEPEAVFVGVRRGTELAEHYASADLFLFPSLTDTFGNVVAEALASGLLVVAYDCAAAQTLIRSGHNGLTVRPNDRAGFIAHASAAALRLPALQPLREAARRSAEQIGWDAVLRRFETSLLQLAQAPAALDGHAPAT